MVRSDIASAIGRKQAFGFLNPADLNAAFRLKVAIELEQASEVAIDPK
jgi:hypothetical protein